MAIRKSEAVILNTIPYGETSKILTIFTRDFGKLAMMAKGARNTKSKFGGALEVFTHLSVIFYERETRDMQYVSDVSIIHPFLRIRNSMNRTYTALAMVEICNRVIHGNEENQKLFDLLTQTLDGVDAAEKFAVNGFLGFLIHVAELLGFKMEMDHCTHCPDMLAHEKLQFNFDLGRVACERCPGVPQILSNDLSKESVAVMRQMSRSLAGVHNLNISERARNEIFATVMRHLQYHVDELKTLHSLAYVSMNNG